jgi:hypothetical protein
MRKLLSFFYHMLPVACGGVMTIAFGVMGWTDAGNPGAAAGAVLGLIVGAVVGFLAANILALLFGRMATGDPKAQHAANAEPRPVRAFICRAIVIAALLTILHDGYWFAHIWMAEVNFNAGAYMTRSAQQKYSRGDLKTDLDAHAWRHEILAARPLKWMFKDEAEVVNQANREVIAVATSTTLAKPGARVKDMPTAERIAIHWGSSNWFEPQVTDRAFSNFGTAVCAATLPVIDKHQAKGLILRFLPKTWFR